MKRSYLYCEDAVCKNYVSHQVAVVLYNNTVELYSLHVALKEAESRCLRKISSQGHHSEVRTVAFSSDNLAIVSGCAESLKMWNRWTEHYKVSFWYEFQFIAIITMFHKIWDLRFSQWWQWRFMSSGMWCCVVWTFCSILLPPSVRVHDGGSRILCIVEPVLPGYSHIPENNLYFLHHLHTTNVVHKFNLYTKQLPDSHYIGLTVIVISPMLLAWIE